MNGSKRNWRDAGLPTLIGMLLVCFGLVAAAGCAEKPTIAPGPRALTEPPDLEAVKQQLMLENTRWKTLSARCMVNIRSDYIRAPRSQAALGTGRLEIGKPGKIRLRVPEKGPAQLKLVGDGQDYSVEMPIFGLRYSGSYGGALPRQGNRVLLMPDDLVKAFDWSKLFTDKVQVPRQQGFSYVIDSLKPVTEPEPALRLVNSLTLSWDSQTPVVLTRYEPDGSLRSEMRYFRWDTIQTGENKSTRIPSRLWVGYMPGRTATLIGLRDIVLNERLEGAPFGPAR